MRVSLPATVEWTTGSSTSTVLRTGVIPVRVRNDDGVAGGVLVGKKFQIIGVPFRIELDGTFGDMSATTNTLDARGSGRDGESGVSLECHDARRRRTRRRACDRLRHWRVGAIARVANSVTDIDSNPTRIDHDDSFRDSSTEIGWVIGVGVETLADYDSTHTWISGRVPIT